MEELLEVVGTFYSMEGVPKEAAKSKAEAIFKSLDTNGDGTLDEDEFCEGVLNDQGTDEGLKDESDICFPFYTTCFLSEFAQMIQSGVDKLKTEQEFAQKVKKQ